MLSSYLDPQVTDFWTIYSHMCIKRYVYTRSTHLFDAYFFENFFEIKIMQIV